MKFEFKHLRILLKRKLAKFQLAQRWRLEQFRRRGERHFAADPRFDLANVRDGFVSHLDDPGRDDQRGEDAILERICSAYIKAAERQKTAPAAYRPTDWWEQRRKRNLQPVMTALAARDLPTLRGMYRNFYRDPCSAGLIVSQTVAKDYFGERMTDFHAQLYLIDALYRLDYWQQRTGGRTTLNDLSGPLIGNPFGVVIDGILVRSGADYQQCCAQRIHGLLGSKKNTVAEIGGGFGGMAYYLLRDRAETTYIDFDVPESIALTSYYLLKAFPQLRFLLYGEEHLTSEAISRADVALMPLTELVLMPAGCADLTFSSHAMSDLSMDAMVEYVNHVAAMTKAHFLYVGREASGQLISELLARQHPALKLVEKHASGWHDHRVERGSEIEYLFRMEGS